MLASPKTHATLGARAGLHDVLATAVEEVPPGGRLIVVSRETPPAPLARLAANQAVKLVDYDALRLTDDVSRGLVRRLSRRRIEAATLERVVATANGWAAGLVLLTARVGGDTSQTPRPGGAAQPPPNCGSRWTWPGRWGAG
jgi:ATP/maltotriose-dependent transcriptional regulator MalT